MIGELFILKWKFGSNSLDFAENQTALLTINFLKNNLKMRRTRENEENRKETYNAVIPPPGRQSPVDRQIHYKKPQR